MKISHIGIQIRIQRLRIGIGHNLQEKFRILKEIRHVVVFILPAKLRNKNSEN